MTDGGREAPGDGPPPPGGVRPTRKNLTWALDRWLGDRVKPDDLVVFYFAGRGVRPRGRLGRGIEAVYLVPTDARRRPR